jgi:hypothetical protein
MSYRFRKLCGQERNMVELLAAGEPEFDVLIAVDANMR